MKQMTEDPWVKAIPDKYIAGQIVQGVVTKLTNFGVFVQLEPDLEGLLHVSELSDQKVDSPQDVVKVGQDLEVKILRVDTDDRKIGLSLKRAQWAAEDSDVKEEKGPQRGGLDGAAGMGTDFIDSSLLQRSVQQVSVDATPTKAKPDQQTEPDTPPPTTPSTPSDATTEISDTPEPAQQTDQVTENANLVENEQISPSPKSTSTDADVVDTPDVSSPLEIDGPDAAPPEPGDESEKSAEEPEKTDT